MSRDRSIEIVDDGCEAASSCFVCPLLDCKYDVGNRRLTGRKVEEARGRRDVEIIKASEQNVPVSQLAVRFGVNMRTIYRVLKRSA
ncbi:hypothetical protein LCGC14_0585330 [marine sediment metagenome]|uniref:Resolvase HTH domain-containing protein n=1 Tax=marine sediment metagenome TaxID=412755 RepID=A0A0F9U1D5_9ZZZZ